MSEIQSEDIASETVISADPETLGHYLRRVWRMRDFAVTLAYREIKVRYSNTYFGILWVFLQPLPSIIVFTFFFGRIIEVDTGNVPYSIFALIGLIAWNYFTNLALSFGNILFESSDIIKRISFPRLLLLVSRIFSGGLDFCISLALVAIAMVLFGTFPNGNIVFFPLFLTLNIIFGFSVGIWFCMLTYRRKDLLQVVPVIIGFGVWLTPVFFPTTILPQELSNALFLNPMTLVCEGYRFALIGGPAPDIGQYITVPLMLALLVLGINRFRRIDGEIPEHL